MVNMKYHSNSLFYVFDPIMFRLGRLLFCETVNSV